MSLTKVTSSMMAGQTVTYRIPTDYPTLQAAIDALSPTVSTDNIELLIESGHQPTRGVSVSNGDYSQFVISAEAAEVTLAATFPREDIVYGSYAKMPRLNCLINANSLGENGYHAAENSQGWVNANCGIKYCYRTACLSYSGSVIYAEDCDFTYAAQDLAASGILAWGARVFAEGSDASNSGQYGAQAAAGGILSFRDGVANNTGRYGVRATNQGIIDARRVTANGNAEYGIYAFRNSQINAMGAVANDNVTANIIATSNSTIGFNTDTVGQTCDGGGSLAQIYAAGGGVVDCSGATLTNGTNVALSADALGVIVFNVGSISGAANRCVETNSGKILISNSTINGTGTTDNLVRVEAGEVIARAVTFTSSSGATQFFVNDGSVLNLRAGSTLDGSPVAAGDTNVVAFNTLYPFGIVYGP